MDKNLEYLENLKKEHNELLEKIKNESKNLGYIYDEEKNCFLKESEIVHILDIFVRAETLYESSGYFIAYSNMILIPNELFEKIKNYLLDGSVDDFQNIFEEIMDYDSNILKDFNKCLDYSSLYEFNEDNISFCKTSKYYKRDYREGLEECFGDFYIKEDGLYSYLSFFDMKKDIFDKCKHSEMFWNEKFIRDNACYKFNNKEFYVED